MILSRLSKGEVVNLRTLRREMPADSSFALVKTSDMEVIRVVLSAGKKIPQHSVPGQLTVQCISGHALIDLDYAVRSIKEGDWLYLERNQAHALEAVVDSVLLVTILLRAVH